MNFSWTLEFVIAIVGDIELFINPWHMHERVSVVCLSGLPQFNSWSMQKFVIIFKLCKVFDDKVLYLEYSLSVHRNDWLI